MPSDVGVVEDISSIPVVREACEPTATLVASVRYTPANEGDNGPLSVIVSRSDA
jgi:hypothetical protein